MFRKVLFHVALLVAPNVASACPAVQQIVAVPAYSQAIVAAPVVYQPQVVQQVVAQPVVYSQAVVAQPVVVQNVIVKQQRQRRHPVRNTLRIVTPPFGHCR